MKRKQSTRAKASLRLPWGRAGGWLRFLESSVTQPTQGSGEGAGLREEQACAEHGCDWKRRSSKGSHVNELEQPQKVSPAGGKARLFSTLAMGGVNVSTKKYYPETDSHTIEGPEFTGFQLVCMARILTEADTYALSKNTAQTWAQNIPRKFQVMQTQIYNPQNKKDMWKQHSMNKTANKANGRIKTTYTTEAEMTR